MTQAPNVVDPHQLEVLGLAALLSKEGTGKAFKNGSGRKLTWKMWRIFPSFC